MKSWEIIGWEHDGEVYCTDHRPAGTDSPIFADSEWDYIPACDTCHEPLTDVSLTAEGMDAVRTAIFDWHGTEDHRAAYIQVANDHGIDLTRYAYGIGAAGCLWDSVSGPYDTEQDAIESLREVLTADDEPADGPEWIEVEPGFWTGPGTYYAEVFDVDEDWTDDEGPSDWPPQVPGQLTLDEEPVRIKLSGEMVTVDDEPATGMTCIECTRSWAGTCPVNDERNSSTCGAFTDEPTTVVSDAGGPYSSELYAYAVIVTGDSPTGWAVVRGYASGGHGTYRHYEPADERTGRAVAHQLNKSIGISDERAFRIIGASMFPRSVWADEFRATGDIK